MSHPISQQWTVALLFKFLDFHLLVLFAGAHSFSSDTFFNNGLKSSIPSHTEFLQEAAYHICMKNPYISADIFMNVLYL